MEESLQFSAGIGRLCSVTLAKNCKEPAKTSTLRCLSLCSAVSLCCGAQPLGKETPSGEAACPGGTPAYAEARGPAPCV